MLRSMYSGIGGMKNFQTKLDVIGNNIANVNTYGFKKGRVTFKDIASQTISGASSPQPGIRGGTNAMQVGLGAAIASIDTIVTNSSLQTTSRPLDVGIDGDGFFIVSQGNQQFYTRAGNFNLDPDGNLLSPDGLRVMGYPADDNGIVNRNGGLATMRIDKNTVVAPKKTSNMTISGNLSASSHEVKGGTLPTTTTGGQTLTLNFGTAAETMTFTLPVIAAPGYSPSSLITELQKQIDQNIKNTPLESKGIKVALDSSNNIVVNANQFFNASGPAVFTATPTVSPYKISSTVRDTLGKEYNIDLEITRTGANSWDVLNEYPKDSTPTFSSITFTNGKPSTNNVSINFNGVGTINLDTTAITAFASASSVSVTNKDDFAQGKLESFSIGQSGEISGVFDNGQVKVLGQLSIATFANPSGLVKAGGNLFQQSVNSGLPNRGIPGDGKGVLKVGSLEMSNVDLSEEFTEMIVAQRGFQANSRIITTSDQILEELVNLKR